MRALLRRQELERQPLDLNPLVEDVFRLVSADAAMRRITVNLDLSPDLPKVAGDRIHLQQMLLNLILNAMEAMIKSSTRKSEIAVRTRQLADGSVEISVTDSGPGIRPDNLPRLFEPFFTTKQNGMGMGLAICHRIVEAHSGCIRAENQPAGGAVFCVTLPVKAEERRS
jgi:signal transduction histidine kinase